MNATGARTVNKSSGAEPAGGCRLRSTTSRHASLALVLLTLLAPAAHAQDEYYARVDLHPPEAPADREGYDCAAAARPATTHESLAHLLGQVDPAPLLGGVVSLEPLVPRCVALAVSARAPLECSPAGCVCPPSVCSGARVTDVGGYVAYEVGEGRYVLEVYGLLQARYAGDSGVGVEFDCLECPPPWETLGSSASLLG